MTEISVTFNAGPGYPHIENQVKFFTGEKKTYLLPYLLLLLLLLLLLEYSRVWRGQVQESGK